jgi:hypothetical protein
MSQLKGIKMSNEHECKMNDQAKREVSRMINRHKARMLTNLEAANCPKVFVDYVTTGLNWLRSDLDKVNGSSEQGRS